MTISVIKEGELWIVRSAFSDKDVVKAAGARWNPDRKLWWTDKAEVAAKLAQGDAAAVEAINAERRAKAERAQQAVQASRATDATVDLPAPAGLVYKPYQRAGIAFALDRPNVLFADEQGLGKTIEAIGVINADPTIKSVLIVCPAGIKLNWRRELQRWLTRPMSIGLATSEGLPQTNVVIVNYDILLRLAPAIRARTWALVCLDEVHYAKNKAAQRTQALFGRWDQKTRSWEIEPLRPLRWIAMTGTPILNRPKELWTMVHAFDRQGLGRDWRAFHQRYCAGHQDRYGWNIDGASHLDELNTKLRSSFMVRRLKRDVLPELPPKVRQVIVLEPSAKALALIKREAALLARVTEAKTLVGAASDDEAAYQAAIKALEDASARRLRGDERDPARGRAGEASPSHRARPRCLGGRRRKGGRLGAPSRRGRGAARCAGRVFAGRDLRRHDPGAGAGGYRSLPDRRNVPSGCLLDQEGRRRLHHDGGISRGLL